MQPIIEISHLSKTYESGHQALRDINLNINNEEWESIKARHAFAHGELDFDVIDWESLINKAQTYETVFHKIIGLSTDNCK